MCAVRALTSGEPEVTWRPETEGQEVSGVVLSQGETASYYGPAPYVDLWLGGAARVRVVANPIMLRAALERAAPEVGGHPHGLVRGLERTDPRPGAQPVGPGLPGRRPARTLSTEARPSPEEPGLTV